MAICLKVLVLHCLFGMFIASADQRCENGCPGDNLQNGSDISLETMNCSSLQPGVIVSVGFADSTSGIVTIEYSCTLTVNGSVVMNDSCVLIDNKPVSGGQTVLKSVSKTLVEGVQCIFWGCYRIGFAREDYSIRETSCMVEDSSDIDLHSCEDGIHNCSKHARCIDTTEGTLCKCRDGLIGDRISCLNITHCTLDDGGCFNCSNYTGVHQCSCSNGFARTDVEAGLSLCEDVNECELETHSCSTAANCDNVAGSYVCTCQKGYTGDGLHCVPIDYGTPISTLTVETSDTLTQTTIPIVLVFGAVLLVLVVIVTTVLLKRNNFKTKFKLSYDDNIDLDFDPVSVTDPPYPSNEQSYEPSLCEEFVHITIKRQSAIYTSAISISELLHAVSDAGILPALDKSDSDKWTDESVPVMSQSWQMDGTQDDNNCMPSNSLDSLEFDMGVDSDTSDSEGRPSSELTSLPIKLTNTNGDRSHTSISDHEETTEYIVLHDFRDGGV